MRRSIFDRFARAVSPANCGGLGLGLWTVREIARAHGGDVTVGETPGGGATFRLAWPCAPVAGAPAR